MMREATGPVSEDSGASLLPLSAAAIEGDCYAPWLKTRPAAGGDTACVRVEHGGKEAREN